MTKENDNSADLGRYVLSLGDSVLRGVAENACGSPVSCARADVEPFDWPIYGCGGEKLLLRLSYETTDGDSGETEVYVKRQDGDPGYRETAHYHYLDSHFKGHHSMADDEWQAVCRERLETDLANLLNSLSRGPKG